jgi:hypothetical protein
MEGLLGFPELETFQKRRSCEGPLAYLPHWNFRGIAAVGDGCKNRIAPLSPKKSAVSQKKDASRFKGGRGRSEMPRYFFHLIEHGEITPDEEGSTCPDLECAKIEAKNSALDIAQEAVASGRPPDGTCVEIRDGDGRVLAALTVAEVMRHPRAPKFDTACGLRGGILH